MHYDKFSRRMFLRSMTGALLPIPLLPSLLSRQARAQTTSLKRYYICLFSNFEYGYHDNWVPSINAPANSFVVPGHHTIHYAPLSTYAPSASSRLSPIFGTALNNYLNQMNVLFALDAPTYLGHNVSHLMGNWIGNETLGQFSRPSITQRYSFPSIDQLLAANLNFNPNKGPAIVMGTEDSSTAGTASFAVSPSGNVIEKGLMARNPRDLYNQIFFYGSVAESGQTTTVKRSNILNEVMNDFRRIFNSTTISTSDRQALENIMDTYSDVQRSISTANTSVCSHAGLATTEDGSELNGSLTHQNYARVLAAAIKCDLTRSVSYGVHLTPDEFFRSNGSRGNYHQDVSHNPHLTFGGIPNKQRIANEVSKFINGVVKEVVDQLASSVDPSNGQTYLYNSLVHVGMESSTTHNQHCVPTLLIGNANGGIQTGRFIDYRDHSPEKTAYSEASEPGGGHDKPGFLYNRLLVTIAQAMGLSESVYSRPSINQHLIGITDGRYGTINNGISSLNGYGLIAPPIEQIPGGWGRGVFTRRIGNYNLHSSGQRLPLL